MHTLRRLVANPGVAVLPLRLFLGVTFIFAGLQKFADPRFLDGRSPDGLHAQLLGYARTSPVAGVLRLSAHHATLLGILIAMGELAAGVGALLGLWTRFAAAGGIMLSAGFLLGVSWHTHPYYLGPDIFSLFAWTPLLVVGSAGVLSLEGLAAARARESLRLAPAGPVVVDFANVRTLCGQFDRGRCRAREGAMCEPSPCPVLTTPVRPAASLDAELTRRTLMAKGAAAAVAGVAAVAGAGAIAGIGRLLGGTSDGGGSPLLAGGPGHSAAGPAPTAPPAPGATTTTAPAHSPGTPARTAPPSPPVPRGTAIGPAAVVPVGGAARFVDPRTGDPSIVLQPSAGRFVAHSAVCTHAGCTVRYAGGGLLVCPCHGAEFDAASGQVMRGPARQSLPAVPITEGPDGQLYVT